VRRFEWLTLCPKLLVLPQTSHFPATAGLPSGCSLCRIYLIVSPRRSHP
jgi:hypothetical protein